MAVFGGEVHCDERGVPFVRWYDPKRKNEFLASLNGKRIRVSINPAVAEGTERQHRFYRGVVLPTIAAELGYERTVKDLDRLHQGFKGLFLTYEAEGRKVVKSTADLSVEDFSNYLDAVIRYAAVEFGIVVPDPE